MKMKKMSNKPFLIANRRALMVFGLIAIVSTRLFGQTATVAPAANATAGQPEVLTNNTIIQMKTAGFGPNIIISKINSSPCNFTTDVNSLVALKNANVDETVIDAMMKKAPQSTTTAGGAPCSGIMIPTALLGTMIDDETYITTKGVFYTVGQKIKLGPGTSQGGSYRYVMDFNVLNSPEYDKHAGPEWAGKTVTISKFVTVSGDPSVVYLLFKTTTIKKSGINIEAAIGVGEVAQ